MTQFYIGCKQVEAWPEEKGGLPGYAVKYPDGHVSWSPKDVFERAHLPMGFRPHPGSECGMLAPNADSITEEMVLSLLGDIRTETLGQKTTVVHATLANGFEIVESSSCVDPANYSEELGVQICLERIRNRVWYLLGFLLQTARSGIALKS